jgi:hypothetical protein
MLLSFLKSLFSARAVRGAGDELPVTRARRIKQAHTAAPIAEHLRIAFGDMRMGNEEMLAWVRGSLAGAETLVDPLKALHRPLAAYFLARYFLHALRLEGALAECGVYQGASALALCRAARAHDAGFTGARFHLFDSFAGLAAPSAADMVSLPGGERAAVAPGSLAADEATARKALAEFPQARFHKGWIPQVFGELPEARWAFVHVDVDFHDATLACLEYFYPKLVPGGVMLCDDYGSAWFPGAFRAWDRYCEEHSVPFVVLDTGQAVILKS